MGMICDVAVTSAPEIGGTDPFILPFPALGGAQAPETDRICLEKSWHGLHYLLTGEAWGGEGPLAFLLSGGETIGDEEDGQRWFDPEATTEIHQVLSQVSDRRLWSRFDAQRMTELDVYPGIWEEAEEDLQEEYLGYFAELKRVVALAVQQGQGLLISIG